MQPTMSLQHLTTSRSTQPTKVNKNRWLVIVSVAKLLMLVLFQYLTLQTIRLIYILTVPEIKKKMISVSNLTFENDVFIEFHPYTCFVKVLRTTVILLQGTLENGFYLIARPEAADNLVVIQAIMCLLSVNTETLTSSHVFPIVQCFFCLVCRIGLNFGIDICVMLQVKLLSMF